MTEVVCWNKIYWISRAANLFAIKRVPFLEHIEAYTHTHLIIVFSRVNNFKHIYTSVVIVTGKILRHLNMFIYIYILKTYLSTILACVDWDVMIQELEPSRNHYQWTICIQITCFRDNELYKNTSFSIPASFTAPIYS